MWDGMLDETSLVAADEVLERNGGVEGSGTKVGRENAAVRFMAALRATAAFRSRECSHSPQAL